MARHAVLALALLAFAMTGCGGGDSESDHARRSAEAYVHDLGERDGEAVCADMTRALQKQFADTVGRANPEVQGRGCSEIMSLALRSIPSDQLDQFTVAKIESVKVKGSTGSFAYRLRDLRVPGKVTRESGAWKVSCCVPGQES